MPDPALPQIKVTESHNLEGSAGASGVESPTTTTDGGQSQRPKSSTSSEGNTHTNGKKLPTHPVRTPSTRDVNGAKSPSSPPPSGRPSTAIDPLSIHILKRTHTENTIPQKLRTAGIPTSPNAEVGSPVGPEIASPGRQLTPEVVRSDSIPSKEKKKGVSFLSRFAIIGGKKKDQPMDFDDNESELGDHRTEGMNAHVFSSSIGANGYIPQHKEPPRYIKVRAHHKKEREFDHMFLAQELSGTKHPYVDEKVPGLTTYEVNGHQPNKPSKPQKVPGAIWCTEFSKDGRYLAAAGRDMIVRVWAVISTADERLSHEHDEDVSSTTGGERLSAPVFRSKPVREFQGHTGEVLDLSWSKNNFLLSSSMDKTVRLWHMSRSDALVTFKHKDFVTSIAFHPRDDRFFLAGSLDSILRLWSIPDKSVAYWNQLPDLITAVAFSPDGKTAMAGVLSGLCLFYETEGLKYQTQIHVRSSRGKNAKGRKVTGISSVNFPPDDPNGEVKVLITTNDSRVRIYNLKDKSLETKLRGHENNCSQIRASFSDDAQYVLSGSEDKKCYLWSLGSIDSEKRPMEVFEAHSSIVTAAIMAPLQTRRLLAGSGDPIYDLCNPPPVTLLSMEESRTGSEKRNSDPLSEANIKRPEESPAYIARSAHNDGGIIVTADHEGCIKVYRCDCAFKKRRSDNWETGSMRKIIRTGSIMTKNSGGSHSRRNSVVSQNYFPPHIESWRNAITDDGNSVGSSGNRSTSPGKLASRASILTNSTSNSQNNLANASAARQAPYESTNLISNATPSVSITSPPPSIYNATTKTTQFSSPPTPSFSFQSANDDDPMRLDPHGRSNAFWNLSSWKSMKDPSKEGLKPPIDRGGSFVSQLSSEESNEMDEGSENELTCKKCSGRDFRAKKTIKGLVMVCKSCGAMVE